MRHTATRFKIREKLLCNLHMITFRRLRKNCNVYEVTHKTYKMYWSLLYLIVQLFQLCLSGSLETRQISKIVPFKEPHQQNSVLGFGASLAVSQPRDNDLTTVYVGAPLYRTPGQDSDEPADGSLYHCVVDGQNPSDINCHHRIKFERPGGIGLSVAENDDKVLVCGPQFSFNCWNARIEQRQIGACYTVEGDKSTPILSTFDTSCPAGDVELDVMFVLDESASILHGDFNVTLVWITEVLRSFRKSIDKGTVHVGLVTFATKSIIKLELKHHPYDNFTASIINIPHAFGGATKTPLGIKQAAIEFHRDLTRRNVPKMMIVVTDGKADKGSEAALADVAKKQRDGKVTMVAVGVGRQFSREQLLSIAGKKENVLEVSSFKNLDSLLETLRQVIIESAITILEGANLNATNELAQSQQGIATHISETSNIFLGAPGSFDRIGSVFSYGGAGPEYYRLDIDDFAEYNTSDITYNLQFLHDSYLGYSLSSGKFLPNGTEFVVAGMPRFDSKGIVLIYEASNNNNHIKVKPTGEYCQLGAYFGHSVLTVDANNDGLDDLMVSSPLYSEERSFDQGRVFVFINNPVDPLLSLPGGISSNVLMGSNKGGSRFGMSLMIAGDVDRNGYDDIIIGAPHEDDATGAVYLYFGSEHGFSNKYMERISGSVFGPIRHFGYATFGGKDMDFDGYPDVVVAAPSSDTIVVLRSRPVVDVMARIETDVSVINVLECLLDSPELCAQFNVCMKASYRFGNTSQVFDIQYDIDVDATKLLADRRLLLVDKQNEKAVLQISEDEICWICNLKINPSPFANLNDLEALSQPIEIKVAYAFTEEHTDVVMSPVLDPVAPNYVEDIWLVKPICENETCESNLSMTATYSVPDSVNPIIIYEPSSLVSVKVTVKNNGPDPSTFTTVNITGSIAPSKVVGSCVANSATLGQETTSLQIHNPTLPLNNILESQASYDTRFLTEDLTQNKIEIAGIVFSKNYQGSPLEIAGISKDTFYFSKSILYSVPLILAGESMPVNVYYNKTEKAEFVVSLSDEVLGGNDTDVTHHYTLINNNPLKLLNLPMIFKWPSHTKEDEPLFYLVDFNCEPSSVCKCDTKNVTNTLELPEIVSKSNDTRHLLTYPEETVATTNMRCSDVKCQSLYCLVSNLAEFSEVTVSARLKVWLPTFFNESSSTRLFSNFYVNTSHLSLLEGNGSYTNRISTFISEYTPIDEEPSQSPVNIWIIIGSVLGGLLMLILLVILAWKAGFFGSHYGELLQAQQIQREASQSVIE